MKVTSIKQQVKRKDRFSVYVDEKYAFSFSQDGLLRSGLKLGDELSDEDVAIYKRQSDEDKLYDRLLNLLMIRPRSEWELRSYLQRKKIEPDLQAALIRKLRERGYVDDEAFAKVWVENRRLLKPMSRRKLFAELKAKRVPQGVIESVLSEDETDEREVLKDLIARKRRQTRYQDTEKLMQYLARQGFSYGDIKAALEED